MFGQTNDKGMEDKGMETSTLPSHAGVPNSCDELSSEDNFGVDKARKPVILCP